MTTFILNEEEINTALPPGTLLLDFIRYHKSLTGTKIGCREGDCGACTILVGEWQHGNLQYSSATSCLMALGNAAGKHIVTIEGLNGTSLNLVQEAFAEEGASQCGFCTPGFIVALTGFCMQDVVHDYPSAVKAMDGNICRCTGYKSIERAAEKVCSGLMADGKTGLTSAIEKNIIPRYFENIASRLQQLPSSVGNGQTKNNGLPKFLGGGTDLYVQQHDSMPAADIAFLYDRAGLNGITEDNGSCYMGGSVTVTDLVNSKTIAKHFPDFPGYARLVSSTPIRNMATLAGNFVNASPIGDFTVFFLALDAEIELAEGEDARWLPLRKLYKGYKQLDKSPDEYIRTIRFHLPGKSTRFNFEKVSKRTHLDIASVNSAFCLEVHNNIIIKAGLAAGGVAPVPLYLEKASAFLAGKEISIELLQELLMQVNEEISPISDARGAASYKRLLLAQLIKSHFLQCFPHLELQPVLEA
ncbi:MAG: FAD binding domain-containing protein [Ferruginibacter sp.]